MPCSKKKFFYDLASIYADNDKGRTSAALKNPVIITGFFFFFLDKNLGVSKLKSTLKFVDLKNSNI